MGSNEETPKVLLTEQEPTRDLNSLTAQIFTQFRANLLGTGEFDESFVRKLFALASSDAKPKPKAIETLLQEEEPLE